MPRPAGIGPTEGELSILRIFWERGPSTVREVNRALNQTRKTGYTTTLKLMQFVLAKGIPRRDDAQRPQVYSPTITGDQVERQLVGHLLERVFDGSASQFVQQVLAAKKTSPGEMAEIRRMLRNSGKEKS